MKKVIIIGATSGIGRELAVMYAQKGCKVGVTGRREELLQQLKASYPLNLFTQRMDITRPEAVGELSALIEALGGLDLFILCSGIGTQNSDLDPDKELQTIDTNGMGFTRMVTAAFNFLKGDGGGQIAVISSIAGTKGLGIAPAYSATKRFQSTYMEALCQLAHIRKYPIKITTIYPGFIQTPLLKDHHYPMTLTLDYASEIIFSAIERKKRKAIIDYKWRIVVMLWRLIPSWLWVRMAVKSK